MNKTICIIRSTPNDDISSLLKNRGYKVFGIYKGSQNIILRSLRRFWLKYRLPFSNIWFDKTVLNDNSKKIFIFESLITRPYLKWLTQKKKSADIVIWYWNIVKNTINPNTIKDLPCTLWSFSRVDCAQYGLHFNPPPYFWELAYQSEAQPVDICFVGKDKGRLTQVLKWKKLFESLGLITEFYITPDHPYNKNPNYSKPISYKQSIEVSSRAKAIFDYIETDNSGQSMRVMEALFTHKKIITNNKLVADYDFYCPENFFILNVDSIDRLQDFIKVPYREPTNDIKMRYDFDRFVSRCWIKDESAWWEENEKSCQKFKAADSCN